MLSTFHADLAAFGFLLLLQPAPGTDIPAETHWNAAEMVLHIKQCAGATRKTKKKKGYARSGPQSPQRANRTEKGAEGSV